MNHPKFRGMDNMKAAIRISHQIEKRLAQRIKEKTGEEIGSLLIPEFVDQKIKDAIEKYSASFL